MNIQIITIHPGLSILIHFICTNTNNCIIKNHHHCKHHPKKPPHVNPFYLQSRTTIHTRIHMYALLIKIPPKILPYDFHYTLIIIIIVSSLLLKVWSLSFHIIYYFCHKCWNFHSWLLKYLWTLLMFLECSSAWFDVIPVDYDLCLSEW